MTCSGVSAPEMALSLFQLASIASIFGANAATWSIPKQNEQQTELKCRLCCACNWVQEGDLQLQNMHSKGCATWHDLVSSAMRQHTCSW